MQFLQRFGLGGVAHPGVFLQTVLESLLQVFYQTIDTLLAGLGEILCHVEFADGLAKVATDDIDGTLPTRLLFLHTRDGLRSLESTVLKSIAQETATVTPDDLHLHKGLQILDTGLGQHLLHLMQRLQLTHIHLVDILRHIQGVAIGHPVDTLEILQQLLPRHHMDDFLQIASVHLVQRLDANPVLDGPGSLHLALSIGLAVAHHLQEVLVQALDSLHHNLLLLVGLGIIFLRQ